MISLLIPILLVKIDFENWLAITESSKKSPFPKRFIILLQADTIEVVKFG